MSEKMSVEKKDAVVPLLFVFLALITVATYYRVFVRHDYFVVEGESSLEEPGE